jgi:hypothetical protein
MRGGDGGVLLGASLGTGALIELGHSHHSIACSHRASLPCRKQRYARQVGASWSLGLKRSAFSMSSSPRVLLRFRVQRRLQFLNAVRS